MRRFSSRLALAEALVIASALTLLIASKPTRDREVHVKAGLDLALAYRDQPGGARRGVVSQWLVPIYDFSQGLGQRIPNLISQVTVHPLILVRRGLTVEQMFHLRLFLALTVALFAIGLTLSSWLRAPSLWARALSYAGIIPGVLTYTVHNDWYYQAEQLCGLVSLSVVMFSRVWQSDDGDESARGVASLTILTGTAGWILYLGGHPDWWPFAVWWLPFYVHFVWRYVVRRVSAVVLSCCATAVALTGGVAVIEILTQDWSGAARYSTQSPSDLSITKLWSAESRVPGVSEWLMVWLRMLLAPLPFANYVSGQHVSWLSRLGDGVPRSLNMPVLLLAAALFVAAAGGDRHLQRATRNYMRFAGSVVLGLLFHDSLGIVSVLKAGITNQTADMISPGLAVVSVVAAALARGRVRRLVRYAVALSAVGMLGVAILYFGDPRKMSSPMWLAPGSQAAPHDAIDANAYARNMLLDARIETAQLGRWPLLEAATAIPHAAAVVRSGNPVVVQVSWARAHGALVPRAQQRQFNGWFEPTPTNCIPLALDFLAVSKVIQFSHVSSPPCSADLLDLDARQDDRKAAHDPAAVRGVDGATWIHSYSPSGFRSFWLHPGSLLQAPGDCGVLFDASRCLGPNSATVVTSSTDAPLSFKNLESLMYKWRRNSLAERVLLIPLSYDTSLHVTSTIENRSGDSLKRWNYGGLLAVEVPPPDLEGTVEITVRPDELMYLRSVIPWLNAVIFFTLAVTALRGRRWLVLDQFG